VASAGHEPPYDLDAIAEDLVNRSRRILPDDIINRKVSIPKVNGIYGWFALDGGRIAYIGKATGTGGLQRRIVKRYLNPDSLETRDGRIRDLDKFQIEHPVYVNGKLAIDKGSFRKNVARKYLLKAGQESVDYLIQNFAVSYVVLEGLSPDVIVEIEERLIKRFRPEFNVYGKLW